MRANPARGREPITVWFAAGTYYLPETITLLTEDSGVAGSPVVYAAAAGAEVVLSGGVRVEGLAWTTRDGKIFKTPVPAGLHADEIFVNGIRQTLARYPNFDPAERIFNGYAADAISPARAARWADPTGGFVHAMHRNEWGDFSYRITGKDPAGAPTLEGGWQNNRRMGMHPRYRMVEGIAEELDAPGEWFLDAKANVLRFCPSEGIDANGLARATVEVPNLRSLFEFKGTEVAPVRFVTLRGFTLRHATRTFMDNREPLLRSDWTIYRGGAVRYEGAEDCALENAFIDQVGGNAVFVSNYNRRVSIRGCHIADAGANGVAFVGDPAAVRNPLFEYAERHAYDALDRTPGPKSNNYPAKCVVEECLIYRTGRVEKQSAPVQIAMSQDITVRHCSIYDVPRAGINVGDGCWGGHVIEFCDVFDTVKETGDHGSFNSWGRDRFWDADIPTVNREVAKDPSLPLLDVVKPIVLRNNRWRCDHGWDIDLDDGSSHYEIYDNLLLNGGLKFREGYRRRAENNVLVRNTFHPHVWFEASGDVFARNIVMAAYRPIRMPKQWGERIDGNLFPEEGALARARRAGTDPNSAAGDAMFVDPTGGDFRVRDGSPSLAVGFKNFPMDRFGVTVPRLRQLARVPSFAAPVTRPSTRRVVDDRPADWQSATLKSVTTEGERSAAGLPEVAGVMVAAVPDGSRAAEFGLRAGDVVVEWNGKPIRTLADLRAADRNVVATVELGVIRNQQTVRISLPAKR